MERILPLRTIGDRERKVTLKVENPKPVISITKTMDYVRKPEPLRIDGNLAENWRLFCMDFEVFAAAIELQKKPDTVKTAILLNCLGRDAVEVFQSFDLSEEDKKKYEAVYNQFNILCKGKTNEVYESFVFYERKQMDGEPFDNFLIDLKKQAKKCNFGSVESENRMIRDRIVHGIADKKLQKSMLDVEHIDLDRVVSMARSSELSGKHVQNMKEINLGEHCKLDAVRNKAGTSKVDSSKARDGKKFSGSKNIEDCRFCGGNHKRRRCPAYGKTCSKCQKKHHFASVCTSKAIVNIGELTNSTSNDFYIDQINAVKRKQGWFESCRIGSIKIRFKLDTGADINTIPEMYTRGTGACIVPTRCNLFSYSGESISVFGETELLCSTRLGNSKLKFVVVDDDREPILGRESCVELGFITRVDTLESGKSIFENFKCVFEGSGCFRTDFQIDLKDNSQPVVKSARRIPNKLMDSLKIELDEMCRQKIIEPVHKAVDWVSNVVIVEKANKQLRICLDPKELNLSLKDHIHPIPTFEEISPKLINKKIFTVLDLKQGYYQIKLNEKSSDLCCFSTPFGCFKFLVLPFGLKTATQVFQKLNEENFKGIPNVIIYIDDVLIAAENEKEHDEVLLQVLKRAEEKNIKFNRDKVQYKVDSVRFLGHEISSKGVACDKKRMCGVEELGIPQDKKGVQTLLGFINYMRNYIPNLSEVCSPIRQLLKKNIVFNWTETHTSCLEKMKTLIKEAPSLKPFDEKQSIEIQTDASKSGLGCCLMQEGRPVCFASRSLNEAEIRYAQVEKEFLAVVFACKKFHNYIYGRRVTIVTDHKPLLGIMLKDLDKIPSPRLTRMKLRLSSYDLNFTYKPGKFLFVADLLSRNYSKDSEPEITDLSEMVHSINVSDEKLLEMKKAVEEDTVMMKLRDLVLSGWPKTKRSVPDDIKFYWNVRDDLFLEDGLIFVGDRLLIPRSLRKEMLEKLHYSHFGMEKMKKRARGIMYWPGLNQQIEVMVSKCQHCQKHANAKINEPLESRVIPNHPFESIAMDYADHRGKMYLIVADCLSKFFEIIETTKKTALVTINKLKQLFAVHGIPREIFADNNPFNSFEFKDFAQKYDIKLSTSSPNYPKSNGFAEKNVQIAKNLLVKCSESGRELWLAMLEHRNTPIKNSTLSPSQILMGRQLRSILPEKSCHNGGMFDNIAKVANRESNIKNKFYYDKRSRIQAIFSAGQSVWIRENKVWVPGKIVKKLKMPRSYLVELVNSGKIVRRNSWFLKNR